MDPRIAPLAEILQLNTRLFRNCLDGMTEEQADMRPSHSTNSAAFVAAHLADSRYFLLRILGAERPNPLAPYLEGRRSIDEVAESPPLPAIESAWLDGAVAIRERLDSITAVELDTAFPTRFPVNDQTVLGVLTFLVQHDSYHVGQLALLRKYAGFPAMKYA
jgi:uncharacterized damage-inducible protein DinB